MQRRVSKDGLMAARDEAERANQAKTEFLAPTPVMVLPVRSAPLKSAPFRSASIRLADTRIASVNTASLSVIDSRFAPDRMTLFRISAL